MTYRELCEKISKHCNAMEKLCMTPEVEFWMKTLRAITKSPKLMDDAVDAQPYLDRMANERKALGLHPVNV